MDGKLIQETAASQAGVEHTPGFRCKRCKKPVLTSSMVSHFKICMDKKSADKMTAAKNIDQNSEAANEGSNLRVELRRRLFIQTTRKRLVPRLAKKRLRRLASAPAPDNFTEERKRDATFAIPSLPASMTKQLPFKKSFREFLKWDLSIPYPGGAGYIINRLYMPEPLEVDGRPRILRKLKERDLLFYEDYKPRPCEYVP
ncbi:MAG: hypothetical protein LQ338_006376 [Usnochroma carphineum]|nr:MAG: hypothetical protein LQ338_006376 [Usnochroma carphineum]